MAADTSSVGWQNPAKRGARENYTPRPRQRKLAKLLIENQLSDNPLPAGKLVASVGYSPSQARSKPKEIINSVGVQKALAELGFHEDNAKRVVAEILNGKRQQSKDRLKAADMVFKVQGTYAPERHQTAFVGLLASVEATTAQAGAKEVSEVKGDSDDAVKQS